MNYPLAIFDFDGTLADTLPRFLAIMNSLAETHHFRRIDDSEIPQLRHASTRQIFQYIGLPMWKLPWVTRELLRRLSHDIEGISLFPGVEQGLTQLKNCGMRLSIVSSNSWDNIRRILGDDLSQLFEHVECEASFFGKRPKLRRVLRRAGIPANRAVYLGDELRDLQAAQAEGIAFGAVTWGHVDRENFQPHHPSTILESVAEMIHWLTSEHSQSHTHHGCLGQSEINP